MPPALLNNSPHGELDISQPVGAETVCLIGSLEAVCDAATQQSKISISILHRVKLVVCVNHEGEFAASKLLQTHR